RRHPHSHALPLLRLLAHRPPPRRLALLPSPPGRPRPLARPEPLPNPYRYPPPPLLAPPRPPPSPLHLNQRKPVIPTGELRRHRPQSVPPTQPLVIPIGKRRFLPLRSGGIVACSQRLASQVKTQL